MAGLPVARANVIGDSEMGVSPVAVRQLRLYTTAPTSTTPGVEAVGNGYTPQTITFSANDSTGTSKQAADINFPAATGAWPLNLAGWAITDSTGATQYAFLGFTSVPVPSGATIQFLVASNQVTVQYT